MQTKAIKGKIKSVGNIKKITKTMEMVSAAKMKKSISEALTIRPFHEESKAILADIVSNKRIKHVLVEKNEGVRELCIVVASHKGLCGGYNSFMIKKAEGRYKELKANGIDVDMILVGKKGIKYFTRRAYPIRKMFDCGQNPNAKEGLAIAEEILNTYLAGETDAVELLYTKFLSLIASTPSTRTLVPFSASEITNKGDEVFQLTSEGGQFSVERTALDAAAPQEFPNDMIFEQDPLQIVNSILPLYLNGQILRTLQESVASELAARMASMQAASDNAGALAKDLSLQYNRARQAAVTQELLEIVAGAQALE